jgi:hypothetical protein
MESPNSLQLLKVLFKDISYKARKRNANTTIIADEISFYCDKSLAGMLSTMAGFGVRFILLFQDLEQLVPELRAPILSNCNAKMFFKTSNATTLQYLEDVSGNESVIYESYNENNLQQYNNRTGTEPYLARTRIRNLWLERVAVLIAEMHNYPRFVSTAPVVTSGEFDWSKYEIKRSIERDFRQKKFVKIFKETETKKETVQKAEEQI